ncbi:serine protease [Nocardia sp. alder85J]|uniref:serine protease n=1 Tax=Nocardia sp. alder85J TaxID=2862949 RepID=UPI001CD68EA0|nr:serine protease [Nocardia sp. alder85J]MCX4091495.1 serine protease [Nocardia sp. alder85J]
MQDSSRDTRPATTGAAAAALAAVALAVAAVVTAAPATAIVGGAEAAPGAYPWLAAIGTPAFAMRPGGQFCAGALIAPDQVITAAHCAVLAQEAPGALTATFDRGDLAQGGGITVGIKNIRIDPRFRVSIFDSDLTYHHDLALLTLAQPVAVTPVAVAAPHGDTGTVVGWGATADGDWSNSRLHTVTVPLAADVDCTTAYGTEFDAGEAFCAGSPTADTGEFDSGGPLLVDGKLAGVTSWGKGSAQPGYPGVYARVSSTAF